MTSENYDDHIRKESVKALASLQDEHKPTARAARIQLFDWLNKLETRIQTPAEIVTDEMANHACNALEQRLACKAQGSSEPRMRAVLKAFRKLNDAEQLDCMREVLGAFIGRYAQGTACLTRGQAELFWDHTGFMYDGGVGAVFAKAGNRPYQPIGYVDDEHFVGTEGSKALWLREFTMAIMLPFHAPFEITRRELDEARIQEGVGPEVSLKEAGKINEVLEWFDEFRQEFVKSVEGETDEEAASRKAELEANFREVTLKLARVRLPRLDAHFERYYEEHPEFGPNMESIDSMQIAAVCSELLRLVLDNDKIRREQEAHDLVVRNEVQSRAGMVECAMRRLSRLIPAEGAAPDGEAIKQALEQIRPSLPDISQQLDALKQSIPELTVLEAAEAMLLWLQKEWESAHAVRKGPAVRRPVSQEPEVTDDPEA